MTRRQIIRSVVMLLLPIILLVIIRATDSKVLAPSSVPVSHSLAQVGIGGIWTSEQNAREHFEKHGAEFAAVTVDDYVAQAHDFISQPPAGTLTTKQLDGDNVFFHPTTGRFAVVTQQGKIRTYFVREENLKGYKSNMEYFNEQATRK